MTRLVFLGLIACMGRDRGPETTTNHVTTIHRGIITYNDVPEAPLMIENNSKYPAQITYQGQRFTSPAWSTTFYQ